MRKDQHAPQLLLSGKLFVKAAGAVAGTATSWERGSWSLGESGPRHRVPCSRRGAERHKCRIS